MIPEPMLTVDLEDAEEATTEWSVKMPQVLAAQLGVGNDFYFPLLGVAKHLELEPGSLTWASWAGGIVMVEITGSASDRHAARDVAEWCARELAKARRDGHLETRPFVQNADLIIAALREYGSLR